VAAAVAADRGQPVVMVTMNYAFQNPIIETTDKVVAND